ncbi:MAG: ATP-dependent DNA helicase RecG, partial [Pseudomonadota bacterium]
MGRPEILFPLFAGVETLRGIGPAAAKTLKRLGIETRRDLVFHLPSQVADRRPTDTLEGRLPGESVTIDVGVIGHVPPRRRGAPYRVQAQGGGTVLDLVFFRGSPQFIADLLPESGLRRVSGKLDRFNDRWQMLHPEVLGDPATQEMPAFEPVYPLTEGLTQRTLARMVQTALEGLSDLPDWHDAALARREGWPAWAPALAELHAPATVGRAPPALPAAHGGGDARDAPEAPAAPADGPEAPSPAEVLAASPARRRLAYDELLSHQLALALGRQHMRRARGRSTVAAGDQAGRAAAAFGYAPTGAQARALAEIRADMGSEERMLRLLQGDVGAGKTWVAAMALMTAVAAGGQGALMAPTEILARQHAEGLARIAEAAGTRLTLLTGRHKGVERRARLAAIAGGEAGLIIGTHALFSADVAFGDLRLAVVDEQHRFGVRQRMELAAKAPAGCDLLVMTATPIPRTLALAGYGDLDVSVLDEKPPGRQPVDTRTMPADRLDAVIARLGAAIAEGRRAYWVCPMVEERADSDAVAAEARAAYLVAALGPDRVALIHGQMAPEAKDAAMAAFQSGRAPVLVATTVIEVGVDVPEATIMVIEQAERFGLAT